MDENTSLIVSSENTDIDYIPYSENDQEQIDLLLDGIKIAEQNVKLGVLKIGEYLTQLKAIVIKHGEWEKWLEDHVSFSKETAVRYIGLYEEFGVNPSALTDLKDFGKSKLYILKTLNENEREIFKSSRYYIKHNGKEAIEKRVEEMSTRELEYVVKKYKQIKLDKIIEIVTGLKLNFAGRYNNKKPTKEEQLKVIEEVYKDYIRNDLEQKLHDDIINEIILKTAQKPTEEKQKNSIDETADTMWNKIIRDTIADTQEELSNEVYTNILKVKYSRIGNEVYKLFPDKSEEYIINEIKQALEYVKTGEQMLDIVFNEPLPVEQTPTE